MEFKFLDFEQPIAELEAKIDELRFVSIDPSAKLNQEITHLKNLLKDSKTHKFLALFYI